MIPKFSIRHMLLGMVALGILSTCFASAFRGSQIGLGLSVGILGTLVPFMVYAIVHWGCFVPAKLSAVAAGRAGKALDESTDVDPASEFESVSVEVNDVEKLEVVESDGLDQGALDD